MVRYVDQHRAEHGVESICRQLPIAPATYYDYKAKQREPERRSARAIQDERLAPEVQRVWDENFQVYGVRKVWRQLNREDVSVARCTVARLMAAAGLQGAVRGKKAKTTVPDDALARPLDQVNRQFQTDRPNALWVADITYVATWRGFVYVAFVIDTFARRIVGWRVSSSLETDITLDALEQALWARQINKKTNLIHHSDRGSQYLAIRYAERLADVGISPSVGSVGDSYDNALAETINGLYKTEVIRKQGPWKTVEDVEFATLVWVDWFNNRRLLESIGNVPPAEKEVTYYQQLQSQVEAA